MTTPEHIIIALPFPDSGGIGWGLLATIALIAVIRFIIGIFDKVKP